jgi:hypothetical protein
MFECKYGVDWSTYEEYYKVLTQYLPAIPEAGRFWLKGIFVFVVGKTWPVDAF